MTSTLALEPNTFAKSTALSPDEVYRKLHQAVFDQRLFPGTKLLEERLASTVGLSRAKIRQVLARLAHEQLVVLIPNRGAFVATPSVEEAKEVFAARRILESGMVRLLCSEIDVTGVERLRAHVALEAAARSAGDRAAIIRLSGEFHLLLAEVLGNRALLRMLRELCAQVCLIIALYDKPNTPACPHHEHGDIVDWLERNDADAAAEAMLRHLNHIENTLDLNGSGEPQVNYEALFA